MIYHIYVRKWQKHPEVKNESGKTTKKATKIVYESWKERKSVRMRKTKVNVSYALKSTTELWSIKARKWNTEWKNETKTDEEK